MLRLLTTLTWHLALIACLLGSGVVRAQPKIAVLLSEYSRPHLEMLETLRNQLGREALIVSVNADEPPPADAVLAIAVGVRASENLSKHNIPVPVLATLLPRSSFERIQKLAYHAGQKNFSAIYLDLPPRRQLAFLRLALPERKRIALLTSPATDTEGAQYANAARQLGMSVATASLRDESEIFPALQRLLPDTDILLALPDPGIYNNRTIQDILLTTYHYRVPLVGFSPSYVKAGALLAIYTTPSQIARQAADIARQVWAGQTLPAPHYPKDFEISTNHYVARSLGLSLPEETQLKERLRQLESLP